MSLNNLTAAIQWLAVNGPGLRALKECQSKFVLNAHDTATVCREASLLRGNAKRSHSATGGELGVVSI